MVSAGAIGATGAFAPLAGIAPKLVRRLYELCREEQYQDARTPQEEIAALYQMVNKTGVAGVAGLKGAMRAMGRDCGEPRPPLLALDTDTYEKLASALGAMAALGEEPRGW